MNFEENTGILLTAIHFSADRHRDQRRKDSLKSPYINHPIEVAELLWRVGGIRDEAVLLAAVLHDTIEDTDTTPDEVRQLFGQEVLDIVLECTDDKSLPQPERKRLQIETAPHKSPKAKLVKLADKICNLRDLNQNPPRFWPKIQKQEYLQWSEKVVSGLRGTNPALEALYDRYAAEGRIILDIKPKH
jgi:GTP diphosphokinase / guanosine-3',5'-bis(diphosphate) 3'-diphosphatase